MAVLEIDHAQPAIRQSDAPVLVHAAIVRPAMTNTPDSRLQQLSAQPALNRNLTCYATHL